jgi:putative toxin-antitoxin system antitoxin component (TIGR02293 family)
MRLVTQPKKGAALTVAGATLGKKEPTTAQGKAHGNTHEKTLEAPRKTGVGVKALTSAKRLQTTSPFVAFAGSSVMAHDAVMKGVSGRMLTRIWESTRGTLPADAILKAIGVSARTASRIQSDPDRPLDARTTDGIYRLESVRAMAEEVLGSAEAANEWLTAEAMGLEFRKPIDLVSTSPGAEAVKTLLQRMKYGVYA